MKGREEKCQRYNKGKIQSLIIFYSSNRQVFKVITFTKYRLILAYELVK